MLNKAHFNNLLFQLTPTQTVLITLWILIMISLPIVDWTNGWAVMMGAVNAGVLVQASVVVAILLSAWPVPKTLGAVTIVVVLAWLSEVMGSQAGIPFGGYTYTDALQPQLFHVPLLIPLAWLMMLPPSWGVAQAISGRLTSRWRTPVFIAVSALAMTVWDFALDPQMVAWGLWEWDAPGGFFGIPWGNFLGWLLVAALITTVIRPYNLPTAPLLLVYTIFWLLQTAGLGIFWDMPGPAFVGGVMMGGLVVWGWRAYLNGG